jgi:PAS domain S-box-containing protein
MATPARVLLVDDDPEHAEMAAAALEREGRLAVETADGPASALDRFEAGGFDCVVSDHEMGERTGLDLFAAVRERDPTVPFVLYTAASSPGLAEEALSAGVTDFVRKRGESVEFAVLANRVERLVGRPAATEGDDIGAVLGALPDPVFVLDEDLRLVRWNDEFERRRDGDFAAGDSVGEFVDLVDPDAVDSNLRAALEGETPVQFEVTVTDEDVPERSYEVRISRLTVDDGRRLLGVARDVTERRAAERRSRETERRLRELADNAGDVLWIFDAEFSEALFVNEAYEEVYGTDVDEVLDDGRAFLEAVHPDDREDVTAAIRRLNGGEAVDMEYRVGPPDFDRWVWVKGKPIAEDGEVARVAGFSRDVTERREREREMAAQNRRLERLASIVSHDLKSPLSVVEGSIDLARETGDETHLDRAERAVHRVRDLAEDILTLARRDEAVGATEPVRLSAVVDRAWDETDTTGARLVVESDGVVDADVDRLRQLFANLFANAAQHGRPDDADEELVVRVGTDDEGFYVADDGVGVPADERDRVFEPTYSTHPDGTGLGLDIVRAVAEAHGWSVDLREAAGGGAHFAVSAPVRRPVEQS